MINDDRITQAMREQLDVMSNQCDKPHHFLKANVSLDEWTKLGKPYIWLLVEESNGVVVLAEVSYGRLAAFEHGVLMGIGKNSIVRPNFIVLETGYYDTVKYIWF